jgi:hypothetical protein
MLVFCESSERAMHLRYNKSMPDKVEHRKKIYYNYIFLSYSVYGDGANKLIDSEKPVVVPK